MKSPNVANNSLRTQGEEALYQLLVRGVFQEKKKSLVYLDVQNLNELVIISLSIVKLLKRYG